MSVVRKTNLFSSILQSVDNKMSRNNSGEDNEGAPSNQQTH